jgi:hypothetical protein
MLFRVVLFSGDCRSFDGASRSDRLLWKRIGVRGVTFLGSFEGLSASRILLFERDFLVTAQDIGHPSPPALSQRERGDLITSPHYVLAPDTPLSR